MLSKDKTLLKARLSLAIDNDDFESFRKWVEKIPAIFDKFEWVEGLIGPFDVLIKKIEPRTNPDKYLNILSEELNDFYYKIYLYNYKYDKDINKALKIVDDLIQKEDRKKVKHILMKNKLETLLDLETPDFLKEKINEEIENLLSELENF